MPQTPGELETGKVEDPTEGIDNTAAGATSDSPPEIDPENEVNGLKLYLIHSVICLCTFLVGLVSYTGLVELGRLPLLIDEKDFNLLATAIPRITTQFHSLQDVGWYGAAFSIVL